MKIKFENGSIIEGIETKNENIRGLRSNTIHMLTDEEKEQLLSSENPMKIILDKLFNTCGVPEKYLINRPSAAEIDFDL